MKRALAIARLTMWEGLRMRVVLVVVVVLVFVVLRMPFALRGDETLAGRLQNFLAYALNAVSLLLSLATVFFSCATLTTELRTRSLHMVVTKPVSRFEILAGKWLGVNLLNIILLGLCALTIYGFAVFIRNSPTTFARDVVNLRDVVWTARNAASPTPPDFREPARQIVRERVEKEGYVFAQGEQAAVEEYARQLRDEWLRIPPGAARLFEFNDLVAPESEDTAYQVRFKLRSSPTPLDEQITLFWTFVDPATRAPLDMPREITSRVHEMHQFLFRGSRVVIGGKAALVIENPYIPERRLTAYFENTDALQILYKVSSFESNYVKSVLLIYFRLAFLSALGLFFSTFVSFPVACFCVLTAFCFSLGAPWWIEAIGGNLEVWTEEADPYGSLGPYIRPPLMFVLQVLFPNFAEYDGVRNLIDGYYIRLDLIGRSALHTFVYGIVLLGVPGWWIFRSREVAEVIV